MAKELIILAGLPCAGKSTKVVELLAEGEATVISRDDLLLEYGAEKYGLEGYSDIWAAMTQEDQEMVNKLLAQKISEAAVSADRVIIDMTMLSRDIRKGMMDNFPEFSVKITGFVVSFPTILERNQKRFEETGKSIPVEVLQNMWQRYELPSIEEDERVKEVEFVIYP